MADRSKIEWTDASWNPIRARNKKTGKIGWHCEHVSPGCAGCYAESFNQRLGTGLPFKPGHRDDIELFLDETMLTQPLRWKKPRKIFVCSMTDAFADFITDEMLDRMFAVMALTPQHAFQVLTKRAGRMREYFTLERRTMGSGTLGAYEEIYNAMGELGRKGLTEPHPYRAAFPNGMPWPLPNVWLGVSAERQPEYDERWPDLASTPAAVRFVSYEPALGPLSIQSMALTLDHPVRMFPDWVIAGGESGREARAMHPDWARALRDQCAGAGVAFFFKQWGEWAPSTPEQAAGNPRSGWQALAAHPHVARAAELYPEAGAAFVEHVGKARAGRLLDGVEHNAFPRVPA